jgi:hypothetical protein
MKREEMLVRAYELAYYIHCRKEVAKVIAMSALLNLETAVGRQAERYDYLPLFRRNKVKLNQAHILQRNVFIESEFIEKRQEMRFAEENLTHADMVIRYIKFLVKTTGNCNAFNMLVGLTSFLYSYNNDEVFQQQAFLLQDVDKVKEDVYFRKRKSWLMGKFAKRFVVVDEGVTGTPPYLELIVISDSSQGGASPIGRQKRFRWLTERNEHAQLVCDSLNQFQPWDVKCFLPSSFDPYKPSAVDLMSRGDDAEIYRIHILLHQECFEKMIKVFNFVEPNKSLKVPKFFLGSDELNTSACDRQAPPVLDPSEIDESISILSLQSKKGLKTTSGIFKFVVDESVVGILDANTDSQLAIIIPSGHDILKVFHVNNSKEVQLASYLFEPNILDDTLTIRLPNRHQIVVTVNKSESELVNNDTLVEINIRLEQKKSYRKLIDYFSKGKLAWLNASNLSLVDTANPSAQKGTSFGLRLPLRNMIQAAFLFVVIAVITLYILPRNKSPRINRPNEVAEVRNVTVNTKEIIKTPEADKTDGEKPDTTTKPSKPNLSPLIHKNGKRTFKNPSNIQAYIEKYPEINKESNPTTQNKEPQVLSYKKTEEKEDLSDKLGKKLIAKPKDL